MQLRLYVVLLNFKHEDPTNPCALRHKRIFAWTVNQKKFTRAWITVNIFNFKFNYFKIQLKKPVFTKSLKLIINSFYFKVPLR